MLYQILPSLSTHDAISQHVLKIDSELRNRNVETQIVADHINPLLKDRAAHASGVPSFDNLNVLYHMSISSSLAERLLRSSAKIDMWYHNITPAFYFENWEPFVALELRIARQQLRQLALRSNRALAASKYSVNELKKEGLKNVEIMPVLFDITEKTGNGQNLSLEGVNLLSVGRYAPHKKVEKLISVFSEYKSICEPSAKLHLVGTSASEKYYESLITLINKLNIEGDVIFHENITDQKLADLYVSCDAYVTMSEHEGFCVPVLEAIYAQLPVIATSSAAIPETLGDAGIVLDKDEQMISYVNAIDVVVKNKGIRQQIKNNAVKRIEDFDIDSAVKRTVEWILGGGK